MLSQVFIELQRDSPKRGMASSYCCVVGDADGGHEHEERCHRAAAALAEARGGALIAYCVGSKVERCLQLSKSPDESQLWVRRIRSPELRPSETLQRPYIIANLEVEATEHTEP